MIKKERNFKKALFYSVIYLYLSIGTCGLITTCFDLLDNFISKTESSFITIFGFWLLIAIFIYYYVNLTFNQEKEE